MIQTVTESLVIQTVTESLVIQTVTESLVIQTIFLILAVVAILVFHLHEKVVLWPHLEKIECHCLKKEIVYHLKKVWDYPSLIFGAHSHDKVAFFGIQELMDN